MAKKVITICIILVVVFGFLSYRFSNHVREAEGDCLAFLSECDIDIEELKNLGPLLDTEVSAFVDKNVGEWNIKKKQELWDRYRHYVYWDGVCRGLVEVAFFVLVILGLRKLFSRIYVSRAFYHKFWRPPEDEKGGGEGKD
jgi:hypothetical protein